MASSIFWILFPILVFVVPFVGLWIWTVKQFTRRK